MTWFQWNFLFKNSKLAALCL